MTDGTATTEVALLADVVLPAVCVTDNPCLEVLRDSETGECTIVPRANGVTCGGESTCVDHGVCLAGSCVGSMFNCAELDAVAPQTVARSALAVFTKTPVPRALHRARAKLRRATRSLAVPSPLSSTAPHAVREIARRRTFAWLEPVPFVQCPTEQRAGPQRTHVSRQGSVTARSAFSHRRPRSSRSGWSTSPLQLGSGECTKASLNQFGNTYLLENDATESFLISYSVAGAFRYRTPLNRRLTLSQTTMLESSGTVICFDPSSIVAVEASSGAPRWVQTAPPAASYDRGVANGFGQLIVSVRHAQTPALHTFELTTGAFTTSALNHPVVGGLVVDEQGTLLVGNNPNQRVNFACTSNVEVRVGGGVVRRLTLPECSAPTEVFRSEVVTSTAKVFSTSTGLPLRVVVRWH